MARDLFSEPIDCNTGNNEAALNDRGGTFIKPSPSVNKKALNIMALDIATNTGWCTEIAQGCIASGVWDLSPRKNESKGMRLLKFKASLQEAHKSERFNLIVFEGAVTYGKFPNHVAVELQGVLKLFCEEHFIEYRSYMPTEIKKFATGKGNAKKEAMIEAAKTKYGMQSNDDNEADAVCLYHLAKQDLNL